MLKNWQMSNFKSYRGQHDIPLSWINIIAGANSSGKSTFIQSILLLKQTLQYGSRDRSLLLNGPIIRIGSYNDVLNSEADPAEISIGFESAFSDGEMQEITNGWFRKNQLYLGTAHASDYIRSVSVKADWRNLSANNDKSVPSIFNPDLNNLKVQVVKSIKGDDVCQKIDLRRVSSTSNTLQFTVELDEISKREIFQGKPAAKLIGAYADKFLPQYVVTQYDARAKKAQEISIYLFDRSWTFLGSNSSQYSATVIPASAVSVVARWLANRGEYIDVDSTTTVQQLREAVEKVHPTPELFNQSRVTAIPDSEIAEIRLAVKQALISGFPAEQDYDLSIPNNLQESSQLLADYFTNAVYYLGPLRDAPRPVYQVEALPSATDVGYRGEHTAAVLDINRDVRIKYISPPSETQPNDYVSSARHKTASLHDAVVEWLIYLGVALEVKTADEGVFGNRLQVRTSEGTKLHDLTNVGVGVSQVLPIVVMALLAKPGSLLIFEQPELHLHPKVQARLADFFLSLSLQRKQIIAETHSEYIVDRMRLRVALSKDDNILKQLSILFSERVGGASQLVPIELTEYGSVVSWPKDFFDQSQGDVAQILKAAASKRKARR